MLMVEIPPFRLGSEGRALLDVLIGGKRLAPPVEFPVIPRSSIIYAMLYDYS
jgi:hypothetical protein